MVSTGPLGLTARPTGYRRCYSQIPNDSPQSLPYLIWLTYLGSPRRGHHRLPSWAMGVGLQRHQTMPLAAGDTSERRRPPHSVQTTGGLQYRYSLTAGSNHIGLWFGHEHDSTPCPAHLSIEGSSEYDTPLDVTQKTQKALKSQVVEKGFIATDALSLKGVAISYTLLPFTRTTDSRGGHGFP